MREIIVNMGELEIGYENDILVSLGLGSCVGVIIYDPRAKIASLAHIMLPDSKDSTIIIPEKKAIIADSDAVTRKQIKDALTNQEFSIIMETFRKEDTLNTYTQIKPTISFISAFLPPTDGMDTIHTLMSIDHNANTVILSPSIDRGRLLFYMSNGAREVIPAPFTDMKVKSCIDYILHRGKLKFADCAIPIMIERMIAKGAGKSSLIAKIVGGAHMFPTLMDEEVMNIGKRNVESIKALLQAHGIKIISEETGANIGRTAIFDVSTGILKIRTKDSTKEI